ncbi:MAG: sensor domain-containing diguanylate cyclase [Gammaproteobacteria bacterium]|jgi:diguanylate cyclase (GGDEF)-like protein/PAS domain S-box-containing protein
MTDNKVHHSHLEAILDIAVDAIISIDHIGVISTFNPAAEKLFGYSADEVIGQKINLLMPKPYSSEHDKYMKDYKLTGVKKIIGIGREVVAMHKDGTVFPIRLSVGEAEVNDELIFVGIIHDISELKQQEEELKQHREHLEKLVEQKTQDLMLSNEQLKKLVNFDGLTHLANRRYFDEVLDKEITRAKRYGHTLSLMLCDIDFFKPFNDLYGHTTGDVCLKKFARCLESSCKRASDLAARYGGEEFAVILPHTDNENAIKFAENFLVNIRRLAIPHEASTISDVLTASIGVATMQTTEQLEARALINAADQELYNAKAAGRNRIAVTLLD